MQSADIYYLLLLLLLLLRSTRRENTIRNIKTKISIIEIQNQKNKHEDYTYLHQMHTEKANRPYFGIERKMRMTHDRIISELVNPYSNKIYTKSREIVDLAARPYYQNLYDHKPTNGCAQKIALDSINKIIPPQLRKSMSKPITTEEISISIKSLAAGKSPGLDGITIDFYKKMKN